MARLRGFEEAVAAAHADGELPGLLHLSMGGEAVAAGTIPLLREEDRVFSGHRAHGHFLAAGSDPRALAAELAGRETGLCRGRGGSMHLMDERAVMATGVVGGTLSIAVGTSLVLPAGAVAVAFFGDGAVQTGGFHETLNMAALWGAPVLFVCENNGWVEFSSREEHTPVDAVASYGPLYGIATRAVDGGDVEAVAGATTELLEGIRAGDGPGLLECGIVRLRSHYEGDFRAHQAEGDPLHRLEETMAALGADPAELEAARDRELASARVTLRSAIDEDPPADPAADASLVFAARPGSRETPPARPKGGENMVQAARAALAEAMEADPDVVVLGEDVVAGGPFALTRNLEDRFGSDRVRNTPISEASFMGVGVGLALAGARPFVDVMFDDFVTLASDQLFNHAAKIHFMSGGRRSVPLTVWTIAGAGTRWGAQHSQRLDGWFAQVPGLKLLAPSTPALMRASVAAALADPDPVVVLADRELLYRRDSLPGDDGSPWRPRVVREGSELTLVASGRCLWLALEATADLGEAVEVIDLQLAAPLELEPIRESVAKTSRLAIVHDEAACGAIGAQLAATLSETCFWDLDAPPLRISSPATPVPAAATLEDAYMVDGAAIRARVEEVLGR
ncbi:MAG TPA: thiamine pyrophosphate-dependent enzyme [Solirubrobacterales bacterium]|nr:thiamine pyrophosphate-dependent enzyme [Solirubrobacterales bacterium]